MSEILTLLRHFKKVNNFGAALGKEKKGREFSATYVYKLFNPDQQFAAAVEVREKYDLVDLDGTAYVVDKQITAALEHLLRQPDAAIIRKLTPALSQASGRAKGIVGKANEVLVQETAAKAPRKATAAPAAAKKTPAAKKPAAKRRSL